MPDLQHEGPIAEGSAAPDTFATPDAKRLINLIFEIRHFNELAPDGRRGAYLILGGTCQTGRARQEETEAKLTVPAHLETMHTFDGGQRKYTVGGTLAALDAFCRIQLPNRALQFRSADRSRRRIVTGGKVGATRTAARDCP